jgi:NhaA family Na+:H+ antiporter
MDDRLRGVRYCFAMRALKKFFKFEASGGILLAVAAIAALIVANSPLNEYYHYFFNEIFFSIGFYDAAAVPFNEIKKSLLYIINDGLMVIFFYMVGLEIKRELFEGELASRSRAMLPAIAAVGGMAVPALVYWMVNINHPENMPGWAIASATDIAFALGVLSLLGPRVPISLKILLTAIAIIDDLGAILIIAFFYAGAIKITPLIFAALAVFGLFLLNRRKYCSVPPYMILGLILWAAILKSGVHATIAGVITAMFIPLRDPNNPEHSPVNSYIHALHPWVAFGILPLFAFANAGVPFTGMGLHSFAEPLTLGIILGLFVGKQVGIFGLIWIAVKTGLCPKPEGATWAQIYGVSILCGIGFTMSLFIGSLAFDDLAHQAGIRLGVLTGSVLAATVGYLVLRQATKARV